MKHVCVDYCSGTFGDWLRYFISEHEGFERFKEYGWKERTCNFESFHYRFPNFPLYPNKTMDFKKATNYEKFQTEFKRLMPNHDKFRQVYKCVSHKNVPMSHSCVGVTFLEGEWDYTEYHTLRESDHKFIMVTLNPFIEKYVDVYLERNKILDEIYGRVDNTKIHHEVWKRNYMKNDSLQHPLNYELEINELLDGNKNTYKNLCKFIEVKPLDNWRDYVDEFDRQIFQK